MGNFHPQISCCTSWLQYSQLPTLLPLQFLFSLSRHGFSHVIFSSLNNAFCLLSICKESDNQSLLLYSPPFPPQFFMVFFLYLYIEICVAVQIDIYTEVSIFKKEGFSQAILMLLLFGCVPFLALKAESKMQEFSSSPFCPPAGDRGKCTSMYVPACVVKQFPKKKELCLSFLAYIFYSNRMGFRQVWQTIAEDLMCLSSILITLACNDYSLFKKSSYISAFLIIFLLIFYQKKITTAVKARLFRMVISHKLSFFQYSQLFLLK